MNFDAALDAIYRPMGHNRSALLAACNVVIDGVRGAENWHQSVAAKALRDQLRKESEAEHDAEIRRI